MPKIVYKPSMIFQIYDLARTGESCKTIAKAIGVSLPTLKAWERKKKLVGLALKEGMKHSRNLVTGAKFNFKEYMLNRIPKELKDTWDKITALEHADSGAEKIKLMLDNKGEKARQHLFIYAWTSSNYSLSAALSKTCVTKGTFDRWCTDDPDFLELIEEIEWHKKNFLEDCLMEAVADGNAPCIIHANRTKNRDRGYGDVVKVVSTVEHKHTLAVDISELNLSVDVLREISKALKERNTKQIESKVV